MMQKRRTIFYSTSFVSFFQIMADRKFSLTVVNKYTVQRKPRSQLSQNETNSVSRIKVKYLVIILFILFLKKTLENKFIRRSITTCR
jgi:hypothetical protein